MLFRSYQGGELWDMSLVDPDNRRAVDYPLRFELLRSASGTGGVPNLGSDDAGVSKLWLTRRLLSHRRSHPELYCKSGYEPLPAAGGTLAFERDSLVVVVGCRSSLDAAASVELPAGRWTNLLDGGAYEGGLLPAGQLLSHHPAAVLERAE